MASSAILEFSTLMMEFTTEEIATEIIERGYKSSDGTESSKWMFFTPIPTLHDMIFLATIVALGTILNSVILRCYWNVKSVASGYIRALATLDLCCLAYTVASRISSLFLPDYVEYFKIFSDLIGRSYMLGPLFLVLDRCLIVAFPHNFHQHERKMRMTKVAMVVTVFGVYIASAVSRKMYPEWILSTVLNSLSIMFVAPQFLFCIVLYAVIVVKVLMSDRKMKTSRHIGIQ